MKTRPVATIRSRRALRASVVAVLAMIGAMLWAPYAIAESKTIALEKELQAWFWSSNKEIRQCVGTEDQGLCQVVDGSSASPVEPGHLAVALQAGASDMRSYVRLNLSGIPFGSTLTSVKLTLPVSRTDAADTEHSTHHTGPGAKAPATSSPEKASIRACAVKAVWADAEAAPPFTMDKRDPTKTEPSEPFVKEGGVDCALFGEQGKRVGETAWTFDLTKIALLWAAGTLEDNGVVLLPNQTSSSDSWRVEFHGAAFTVQNNELDQIYVSAKEAGNASVTYTPPVEPPPPPPPTPDPGGGGSGGDVVVSPPSTEPPVAPPPSSPPTVDPKPGGPQPASDPIAEKQPSTPGYVWLALLFALAGFVAFSRAVGVEAGEAGVNRVADVLRRRAASKSGD